MVIFDFGDQMKNIIIKDVHDIPREIPDQNIFAALTENDLTIFGIGLSEVIAFRTAYLNRKGTLPITKKKIEELFKT